MKNNFCVSTILSSNEHEIAMGYWYVLGMQGSYEVPSGNNIKINVYFADLQTAQLAAKNLESRPHFGDISVFEVIQEDWNARWRESMEPAKIAKGFWVSPLWLPPPANETEKWIKIEPKMAFGTGHHETTRLAAQAIINIKNEIKQNRFLDIGTGSGILCFVSEICGANFSLGIEIDNDCQQNLAENLTLNTHTHPIDFLIGTLDAIKGSNHFHTVVMNMILTESVPVLSRAVDLLQKEGLLIWSGILSDEKDKAIKYGLDAGCTLIEENTENEWWCGTFRKESK